MRHFATITLVAPIALIVTGCVATGVDNSPGRATLYEDISTPGRIQGIGIESQDIVSMTDKMYRDMLTSVALRNRVTPARVVIDSKYFYNEGSSTVNLNSITDRLRVDLTRSASA